jgi:hypothetical protein
MVNIDVSLAGAEVGFKLGDEGFVADVLCLREAFKANTTKSIQCFVGVL